MQRLYLKTYCNNYCETFVSCSITSSKQNDTKRGTWLYPKLLQHFFSVIVQIRLLSTVCTFTVYNNHVTVSTLVYMYNTHVVDVQACKDWHCNSCTIQLYSLIIVWYVELSEKQTVSQKSERFEKALVRLPIVPLHCGSSLPVVCESGIWLENSRTLTRCERLLLRDLSLLLAVQVCVVPLDSSSMFCGCSLTHAATASCSIWTSDHAHFRC